MKALRKHRARTADPGAGAGEAADLSAGEGVETADVALLVRETSQRAERGDPQKNGVEAGRQKNDGVDVEAGRAALMEEAAPTIWFRNAGRRGRDDDCYYEYTLPPCPYNATLRLDALEHFGKLWLDAFLVPVLLLLAIAPHRRSKIFAKGLPDLSTAADYGAVALQAFLLTLDVVCLPFFLIAFLGRWRWRRVAERALKPYDPTEIELNSWAARAGLLVLAAWIFL